MSEKAKSNLIAILFHKEFLIICLSTSSQLNDCVNLPSEIIRQIPPKTFG